MHGVILPFPGTPSWRGAQFKKRAQGQLLSVLKNTGSLNETEGLGRTVDIYLLLIIGAIPPLSMAYCSGTYFVDTFAR
jgi:hypothetical protein